MRNGEETGETVLQRENSFLRKGVEHFNSGLNLLHLRDQRGSQEKFRYWFQTYFWSPFPKKKVMLKEGEDRASRNTDILHFIALHFIALPSYCFISFYFLQIRGLLQLYIEQVYWSHFLKHLLILHLCVTFSNSPNISKFFIIIFIRMVCDQGSLMLIL